MSDKAHELAKRKYELIDGVLQVYEQLHAHADELYFARDFGAIEVEGTKVIPVSDYDPIIEQGLAHEVQQWEGVAKEITDGVSGFRTLRLDMPGGLSTAGSAGTAVVYVLSWHKSNENPYVSSVATALYDDAMALHERQDQAGRLLKVLESIDPARAKEMRRAISLVVRYTNGTAHWTDAGTAMRNVLQHLKGDMWALVRKPSEQRADWCTIIERLVKADHVDEKQELCWLGDQLQKGTKSLWGKLSRLLKSENAPSVGDVEALLHEMQTALISLLTRLRLPKIQIN